MKLEDSKTNQTKESNRQGTAPSYLLVLYLINVQYKEKISYWYMNYELLISYKKRI